MKRAAALAICIFAFLFLQFCNAADITKGYAFSPGEQNVTHTKLNNLVDAAVINTAFFTDKSADTTPADADLVLIYSAADVGFRKITLGALIFGNAGLITDQTEKAAPVAADYLLIYDVAGTALKKATIGNMISNSIAATPAVSGVPSTTGSILIQHGGTNGTVTVANLARAIFTVPFTNLPALSDPTNGDALLVFDRSANANRHINLESLTTNLPLAGTLNGLFDITVTMFHVVQSNQVRKLPFVDVWNNLLLPTFALEASLPTNFLSFEYTLPAGGLVVSTNHGLGSQPYFCRWVLVCKTNDSAFVVADELDVAAFYNSANGKSSFTTGSNQTNVFLTLTDIGEVDVRDKVTGNEVSLTKTHWRAKCYAAIFLTQ